jgi:hypothetical protein
MQKKNAINNIILYNERMSSSREGRKLKLLIYKRVSQSTTYYATVNYMTVTATTVLLLRMITTILTTV